MVLLREVAGIGPKMFKRLLEEIGSAEEILKAGPKKLLEIKNIGERTVKAIHKARGLEKVATNIINAARAREISILSLFDPAYPQLLKYIPDPPPILYVRGNILSRDVLSIGVVGSHNATEEGKYKSLFLGNELAKCGVTVISGLAHGIDAAAHRGALEADGRTIAVVGSGLEHITPVIHRDLAMEITMNGAVVSEYSIDSRTDRGKLLGRNRIITGLSQAVVIVEVPFKSSGTMNAFERACKQGKPVFIQKWPENSPNYEMYRKIANAGAHSVDITVEYKRIIEEAVKES